MVHAAESPEEVAFLLRGRAPCGRCTGASPRPPGPPGHDPRPPPPRPRGPGAHDPPRPRGPGGRGGGGAPRRDGDQGGPLPPVQPEPGGGEAPLALYAKHGVELALGTDSRGSSPDLDVKNEARFLWGRAEPRLLVRALTRGGTGPWASPRPGSPGERPFLWYTSCDAAAFSPGGGRGPDRSPHPLQPPHRRACGRRGPPRQPGPKGGGGAGGRPPRVPSPWPPRGGRARPGLHGPLLPLLPLLLLPALFALSGWLASLPGAFPRARAYLAALVQLGAYSPWAGRGFSAAWACGWGRSWGSGFPASVGSWPSRA